MKARPASPYLAPGFYTDALAQGRHRDIVGGRWDETGRLQLALLGAHGMQPHHHLLDIGAGSLRLGCKAVPYLDPGHYWATDASLALMQRGHQIELADRARLPASQLIEDAGFTYPGIPDSIDFAIAWGVFTHLQADALTRALQSLRGRFGHLKNVLFTVFLASDGARTGPIAQPDGVVTHPDRPPYHVPARDVTARCHKAGFTAICTDDRLPRGQRLWVATPM